MEGRKPIPTFTGGRRRRSASFLRSVRCRVRIEEIGVFDGENPKVYSQAERENMDLESLKREVEVLGAEERRKLALFILELEKDHFQKNVGSQFAEDIEGFSRAVQDAAEKVKKALESLK